jgi:sulfatase modifying factor 1
MTPRIHSLVALLLLVAPAAHQAVAGAQQTVRPRTNVTTMARIPAGSYRPLYVTSRDQRVRVAGFALDRRPVTRGEFVEFVRRHAEWRRGNVGSELAEPSYLRGWPSALDAGREAELARPVTEVSWFAADAYCTARGKRLPTLDEWEYAAAANETHRDASDDSASSRRLLASYATRRAARLPRSGSGTPNVYGVRDLHGAVSEWTHDAGPRTAPDATGAHDGHHHAVTAVHPVGCASAAIGAADVANYPAFLRAALRAGLTPRTTLGTLGFRCAA